MCQIYNIAKLLADYNMHNQRFHLPPHLPPFIPAYLTYLPQPPFPHIFLELAPILYLQTAVSGANTAASIAGLC